MTKFDGKELHKKQQEEALKVLAEVEAAVEKDECEKKKKQEENC